MFVALLVVVAHAAGSARAEPLQDVPKSPANADERSAQPVTPPSPIQKGASILPATLLTTFVETAARVDEPSAAHLRRQLAGLPADLNDRAAREVALQLASDAQRSILDAFAQARLKNAGSASAPPADAGFLDRLWTSLDNSTVAITLAILSLIISLVSFISLRSATRQAMTDAGLL
jgi:hypothetical protein